MIFYQRVTLTFYNQLNSTQLNDVYCNKIIVIHKITQRLKPIWFVFASWNLGIDYIVMISLWRKHG